MAPLKAALVVSDAATAILLFLSVVSFRFDLLGGTWSLVTLRPIELAVAYSALWVGTLWFAGLYRLRTHWTTRAELISVLRAVAVLLVVSLSVLYLLELTSVSRLLLLMLVVAQPAVTVASRVALRQFLQRMRSRGRLRREILILGAGPEAQEFADMVEQQRELGLHVIGHLQGPNEETPKVSREVIGGIDDIEEVLRSRVVDEVAVCLSVRDWSYVEPAARVCQEMGRIVRVSIQPLGGILVGGQFEEVAGFPIVSFLYGPDRFLALFVKRLLDVALSAVLLLGLSPLIGVIALYIRLADGAPVLFRQPRVGLNGRVFLCLKFRTMTRDAEERYSEVAHLNEFRGPAFKITGDPRIIRSGRLLRRTSLDELPQLLNVLRGEMSIVGPRPAPPREVDGYSLWQRRRLNMRPGVTGLWQIMGRSERDFDRRVSLDLDYIDRWSLWMDMRIMLRTIPVIISQTGR